jgi:hypothetical protein
VLSSCTPKGRSNFLNPLAPPTRAPSILLRCAKYVISSRDFFSSSNIFCLSTSVATPSQMSAWNTSSSLGDVPHRMAAILSDFISSLPSFPDLKEFRHYLSRQPFHKIHWTLFIATCLVSSCISWASSNPRGNVSYVDSLFLVIAATTQAGLNTVDLSSLSTFQQSLLFLLMICGNQIVVSAIVVHIRKRAFKKRFKSIEKQEKNDATESQGTSSSGSSLGRWVTQSKTLHQCLLLFTNFHFRRFEYPSSPRTIIRTNAAPRASRK